MILASSSLFLQTILPSSFNSVQEVMQNESFVVKPYHQQKEFEVYTKPWDHNGRVIQLQKASMPHSSLAVLSAINPENHVLWGHFDPQELNNVHHPVSDPVLRKNGIEDLISIGVSNFSGSSSNRKGNIFTAMEKFDGTVIGPGETFSFNKILDNVDAVNGFVPEKVILNGEPSMAQGGGICQLSTTVYRAALNAGYPIDERRNHTFGYQKYLPYGLDATIYLGAQDMKFTNDTDGSMMLKTVTKGNNLVVFLYGKKDNREVVVSRYRAGGGTYGWKRSVYKGKQKEDSHIVSHYKDFY